MWAPRAVEEGLEGNMLEGNIKGRVPGEDEPRGDLRREPSSKATRGTSSESKEKPNISFPAAKGVRLFQAQQ
jgi:hypothetical protein